MNINNKSLLALKQLLARNCNVFCNIAEGTHAGAITMIASEEITSQYLLLKAGSNSGEVAIANASDKPIGVSDDEANADEIISVILPASTSSTILCQAATDFEVGQTAYSSDDGKVSTQPQAGSYKIGVALSAGNEDGVVEIDPQGFGESAWKFFACGVHTWTDSTTSNALTCDGVSADDLVIAVLQTASSDEYITTASASDSTLTFNLSENGTSGTTMVSWAVIRKN